MNKLNRKPRNQDMYKAILTLKTVEECMDFFDDLLHRNRDPGNGAALSGRGVPFQGYDL